MDLSGLKDITVKAGQDFDIKIPYEAWPIPTAKWELNDKPIDEKPGRRNMEVCVSSNVRMEDFMFFYAVL